MDISMCTRTYNKYTFIDLYYVLKNSLLENIFWNILYLYQKNTYIQIFK